jgi:UPF0716 family protein affecting phage T7 exclusion
MEMKMILVSLSIVSTTLAIIFWVSYHGLRVAIKEALWTVQELEVCVEAGNVPKEELIEVIQSLEDELRGY